MNDEIVPTTAKPPRLFRDFYTIGAILLCLSYVAFELFYNNYARHSVDDFWFAHAAFRFKNFLPYRDFPPYKTVLGYYFLALPLFFAQTQLQTLLVIKNLIALVNASVLLFAYYLLQRFFSRRSVLISLAMLIFSESVLSYSTNIRVDLFAYWFCLFSLLCILDKRYLLAGILIGLGFATSQKAIWYLVAGNCALFIEFLLMTRTLKSLTAFALFNAGAGGIICMYLIFWSCFVGPQQVYTSVFGEAAAMYHLDWYQSARLLFWSIIVQSNPLLFLLAPITLVSLFVTFSGDDSYRVRVLAITFASTILACLIPYRQVFPYYMQVTYPVFLILYGAFFDWLFSLLTLSKSPQFLWIGNRSLLVLLIAICFLILYLHLLLHLPSAYLLLTILPMLLAFYFHKPSNEWLYLRLVTIPVLFVGFIYPLVLFAVNLADINGDYQRKNIQLVSALTKDGSDYVAGVDLFFYRSQPIAGMKHLMGPAIDFLYQPTPILRRVMLASLDEDPHVSVETIIADLEKSNVKLYVNNYRMMGLPKRLREALAARYQHFWGSIYYYSPTIKSGTKTFTLSFSGYYRIESRDDSICLNGKIYQANRIYFLSKGKMVSVAANDYRLSLLPAIYPLDLNHIHHEDQWQKMV